MIMNALFFLGAVAFLAAAFWQLRPRKSFTDEDGDVALASVFTGISTHDIRNLGYVHMIYGIWAIIPVPKAEKPPMILC